MAIRPSTLPRTRDQVVRAMTAKMRFHLAEIERREGAEPDESLDLHRMFGREAWLDAKNLEVASLYWVTPDMAALALSAGRTLPETMWNAEARPSPSGLMVFDGGISSIQMDRMIDVPVHAVSWGPGGEGRCRIGLWSRADVLEELVTANGLALSLDEGTETAPLLLVAIEFPITTRPVGREELIESGQRWEIESSVTSGVDNATLMFTLNAAWALMQQETVADRQHVDVDRDIRRSYGRAKRPTPEVTLVALRRRYRPTDKDRPEQGVDAQGRPVLYRTVVVGHWFNQAYGPNWSMRRRWWRAEHERGPEDAELLVRQKVNVWSR